MKSMDTRPGRRGSRASSRRIPIHSRPRSGVPALVVPVILLLGTLLPQASPAGAQQGGGDDPGAAAAVVQAYRLAHDEEIRLDGRLDEEVWLRATPITRFRQQEPQEGALPSERTEVYVLYDQDHLYIGAVLHDSEPEGIIGRERRRNAGLGSDDRFMWVLDTFLDGRTGYFFEINPAGLRGDGLIASGGGMSLNKRWDGIWDVAVDRNENGWSAEIRIPFRTLNFDPELDTWGINFQRTVRRKNEEILWSGHRRTQGLFRLVHAGRLTGLDGISQGIGLEVKPYVSAGANSVYEGIEGTTGVSRDVGFDLSYSVTPGIRAALSVNTDFAEVEVDQRRVNLTRFPISFPEQRDFFLEGSGVFSFAPRNGINPFFSRRIGLVGGAEIPIHYGLRLGGQAGDYEMGFYQVRTGSALGIPTEDFTVGRVKRNLFAESTLGLVYTRRATERDEEGTAFPDRHTMGLDLDLSTSRFMGNRNAQLELWGVWHSDPVAGGDGSTFGDRSARGIRVDFPNDPWSFSSSLREFGEAFDPAVGFHSRVGFRRLQPTLTFAPRPESLGLVRRLQSRVWFEYLTDLQGELLDRNWNVDLLRVDFESGDHVELSVNRSYERLRQEFQIYEGIVIEPGAFTTSGWSLSGGTAGRRAVSLRGEYQQQGFWDGDRNRVEVDLTARPTAGVSLSTTVQRNEVTLPRGAFDTHLVRFNWGWDLSPDHALNGNLQYDDLSDTLGLFFRARWIVRPGSDIYFVYTQNWRTLGGDLLSPHLETFSRGGTMKVNYTFRI
jgi:hypothetical protein